MQPPFFSFNLSSPSGIATLHCFACNSRIPPATLELSSDPDKFTFLLHFQNFSFVFKKILKGKGLFHVAGKYKHLFERVTFPLLF
jgi:hypothetical protein